MADQFIKTYIDFLPNQPKNEHTRDESKRMMRERFEQGLSDAVERSWDLPALFLRRDSAEEQAAVDYLNLLLEARELFIAGHFYSCVAMCGIVGERLTKDMLRASVLVRNNGIDTRPTNAAFDKIEHVDIKSIVTFLAEAHILGQESKKAAHDLLELRNTYAHGRGKDPNGDSLKAIRLLHTLVEGTVSVFKDFEIKDGTLVPKASASLPTP